jgi:hypothetical protein
MKPAPHIKMARRRVMEHGNKRDVRVVRQMIGRPVLHKMRGALRFKLARKNSKTAASYKPLFNLN